MLNALLSKLPASRAADWGFKVSVGIAILCEEKKTLICVSDNKVNFGTFSADMIAMKDIPIYKKCTALVAGNDMEHATPILQRAVQIIYADSTPKSPEDVANSVDHAFGERLHREIERKVLRKRGFTVQSFLDQGKQKCTPSAYLTLCNRIDQVSLSLKFLICGFDEKGIGHIYCVDGESAPANYDSVGMWAIGTGAHAALSSLAFHADKADLSVYKSREEAAYFALAAKFMAESSDQVGKVGTFISVIEANQKLNYISFTDIANVRALWESDGAPRVPAGIAEFMKPLIHPLEQD